jgi:hypothetical protein
MTNAIVGFPTHTERATPGSWTGSWSASYPAANLNSLPLGRVARSTDANSANTRCQMLLPDVQPVGLVTLINHNASNAATVTITAFSDAGGAAQVASVTTPFWPSIYDTASLLWEDPRWWDGRYSEYEKAGTVPILPVQFPANVGAQLIRVQINDPANPAGFVQVGYCDVATATPLEVNFRYGAQWGFRDRSTVIEAAGGAKFFNPRGDVRIFRGEIDYLPDDQSRAVFYQMQRQLGSSKPFVWLPFPDRQETWITDAFLARQAGLDPLTMSFFTRNTIPLNFEEVR